MKMSLAIKCNIFSFKGIYKDVSTNKFHTAIADELERCSCEVVAATLNNFLGR